jgi:hypothetical protein
LLYGISCGFRDFVENIGNKGFAEDLLRGYEDCY